MSRASAIANEGCHTHFVSQLGQQEELERGSAGQTMGGHTSDHRPYDDEECAAGLEDGCPHVGDGVERVEGETEYQGTLGAVPV